MARLMIPSPCSSVSGDELSLQPTEEESESNGTFSLDSTNMASIDVSNFESEGEEGITPNEFPEGSFAPSSGELNTLSADSSSSTSCSGLTPPSSIRMPLARRNVTTNQTRSNLGVHSPLTRCNARRLASSDSSRSLARSSTLSARSTPIPPTANNPSRRRSQATTIRAAQSTGSPYNLRSNSSRSNDDHTSTTHSMSLRSRESSTSATSRQNRQPLQRAMRARQPQQNQRNGLAARRGRRTTQSDDSTSTTEIVQRRRGRPPGRRNQISSQNTMPPQRGTQLTIAIQSDNSTDVSDIVRPRRGRPRRINQDLPVELQQQSTRTLQNVRHAPLARQTASRRRILQSHPLNHGTTQRNLRGRQNKTSPQNLTALSPNRQQHLSQARVTLCGSAQRVTHQTRARSSSPVRAVLIRPPTPGPETPVLPPVQVSELHPRRIRQTARMSTGARAPRRPLNVRFRQLIRQDRRNNDSRESSTSLSSDESSEINGGSSAEHHAVEEGNDEEILVVAEHPAQVRHNPNATIVLSPDSVSISTQTDARRRRIFIEETSSSEDDEVQTDEPQRRMMTEDDDDIQVLDVRPVQTRPNLRTAVPGTSRDRHPSTFWSSIDREVIALDPIQPVAVPRPRGRGWVQVAYVADGVTDPEVDVELNEIIENARENRRMLQEQTEQRRCRQILEDRRLAERFAREAARSGQDCVLLEAINGSPQTKRARISSENEPGTSGLSGGSGAKSVGTCTICMEDEVQKPVGCLYCRQLIGCERCVKKWFRTNNISNLNRNSPLSMGCSSLNHRSCPLCRVAWVDRPEVASYPMA
ncbi:hypothetical protein Ddc_08287 [Ditylenchus destructor]|nr:hypothetical protein Ddc_08287 [Ditylenchus destructor]